MTVHTGGKYLISLETSTREYIGAIRTDSLDSIREGIEVIADHPSIPAGIPCIILSKPEPAYYNGFKVGHYCYARMK